MAFEGLIQHFSHIKDPRMERTKKHQLIDILVITVCGFICGADNWMELVQWAELHESWLKEFLELANGIPSHDTFGRVFALIEPKEFEKAFQTWREEFIAKMKTNAPEKDFVAIDGKKLCGTTDHCHPHTSALGMVSAWSSEAGLVLGQKKYDFRENHEKHIMRDMINLLELKGCVVSLDANGACEDIFTAVINKGADFVVGLKRNLRNIYRMAEVIYEINLAQQTSISKITQTEEGHGRKEKRVYELIDVKQAQYHKFPSREEAFAKYPQVKSLGRVTRTIKRNGKKSVETHYYVASFNQQRMDDFVRSVRSHWQIENKLHWVLDVAFNEDRSTVRMKNAAQNVAVLRRLALNLLRQENSVKIGMRAKRMKAAWDVNYLLARPHEAEPPSRIVRSHRSVSDVFINWAA